MGALTKAGRAELRAWLERPPRSNTERIEWLAQLWFMDELGNSGRALAFLVTLRRNLALELATLQRIEDEWRSEDPRYPDELPDDAFFAQLTLSSGLKKGRSRLEWADECIARLSARARLKKGRKQ
jgi:hypothetical protein